MIETRSKHPSEYFCVQSMTYARTMISVALEFTGEGSSERKNGAADAGGPREAGGSREIGFRRGIAGGRSVSEERHRRCGDQMGILGAQCRRS